MHDPVFSIVSPTRNVLSKVTRCVGSVRGQKGNALEHLFHDACSTDGTSQWLTAQHDLQVVVKHDDGMYDAINSGWLRSKGSILSWLNGDEQYLPGTLQVVRQQFELHPDVDFLFGDVIVVGLDGRPVAARRDFRLSPLYIRNGFFSTYSCTMFFRRELLNDGLLLLNSKYRFAADMELILRLLAAGKRALHLPRYLSLFTVDGTNLSLDKRMVDETDQIRRDYGGFETKLARNFVRGFRLIERMMLGRLLPDSVEYDYATDEVPNYVRIRGDGISASYQL